MSPSQPPGAPAKPPAARALWLAVWLGIAVHVGARAVYVAESRFFACEEDVHDAYLAHLLASGDAPLVKRFFLPAPIAVMALLQRAGVPAAWAGILLETASVAAIALLLGWLARALAPREIREDARVAAYLLVVASPLGLVLGHSSLGDPFAAALVLAAVSSLVRRLSGGSRWGVALGALAMGVATLTRYGCWMLSVAFVTAAYVLPRGARRSRASSLGDAAAASIALAGPLSWMAVQALTYGDPFAFVHRLGDASLALIGPASSWTMIRVRLVGLATFAPATASFALAALLVVHRQKLAGAAAFAITGSLGVVMEIALGREHGVFAARFAYPLEIALAPLAAIGVATLVRRASRAPDKALVGGALVGTVALLAVLGRAPPVFYDKGTVELAKLLRGGALDRVIGPGSLLIERFPYRPPYGWAAVGVLWPHWDRLAWGERTRAGWRMFEPTDATPSAEQVPREDLGEWLDRRRVSAIWVVTQGGASDVTEAWPSSPAYSIGTGVLVPR